MKKITLLFLLLISAFYSHALGRVIAYDEIHNSLFATIRSITTCGQFSTKNTVGEVRLIQSYTYGGDMIFLDSIKMGDAGLEILHGLSISEINNDHTELTLQNIECRYLGSNAIEITGFVNGTGHDDSDKYNFIILYQADTGTYVFKQLTDKLK
ncbi:hypothetical protein [Marinicellulosiphila megalodicopiae]|uniref:hypothetical protein n=1 Tax=Marinicellulosiphila megalodicopiae TaxID=2724896 RepID=UPI003BAE598C